VPRKKGYVRAGQIAFLALLPELRREIAEGRSMLSLHAEYRERLGFGYVQFTRYVKDYGGCRFDAVSKPSSNATPPILPASTSEPARPLSAKKPLVVEGAELPTFHYDPMDAYRKKFV
jgi:hypothetical protein